MAKLIVKTRFATVPNNLLNDAELSFKAKGLYGYIQSKPDEWEFSAERIAASSKDGLDSVKAGLVELEKAGYLQRIRYQDQSGFWRVDYILQENPAVENPTQENPTLDYPTLEKPPTYSKKEESKKEVSKKDNSLEKKSLLDTLPERELAFAESVNNFMGQYSMEMLKSFYDYWSEPNSKGKMRFELQDTWEISRRLATWYRNNSKFSTAKPNLQPEKPKSTIDDILKDRGYA